ADGPSHIAPNYPSFGLYNFSLPPGGLSIYGITGISVSTVAMIPYGAGTLIYMGWNWYNAVPRGSQDGGWVEVLADAMQVRGSPPRTPVTPVLLVPLGSVWRYLDNGTNAGTEWRNPSFDDSGWAFGPAQLGYGDGDEATVVG